MNLNKTIYIVNAFTHKGIGGNKAGVVIDCNNLSSTNTLMSEGINYVY